MIKYAASDKTWKRLKHYKCRCTIVRWNDNIGIPAGKCASADSAPICQGSLFDLLSITANTETLEAILGGGVLTFQKTSILLQEYYSRRLQVSGKI